MVESRNPLPVSKGGWRTFLALATDSWMLSAPALVLTLVAYGILALLSAVGGGVAVTPSVASASLAWLLQVTFLWIAFRFFLTRRWWSKHLVTKAAFVVFVIVIVGALVSEVLAGVFGSEAVQTESLGMWLQRSGAVLLITPGWTALDTFRTSMARESELQNQLLHSREVAVELVEKQRLDVVERIKEMLQEALENPALVDRDNLDQARTRMRDLSHELQFASPTYQLHVPEGQDRPGWRSVAEAVLRKPVIRPLLMALTVTIFFAAGTASTDVSSMPVEQPAGDGLQVTVDMPGLMTSLGYLMLVFLTTWLLSAVAIRLTGSRLQNMPLGMRALWVLAAPVLLAIGVQIVIEAAYVLPGISESLSSDIGTRLVATIPIFVIAGLILAIRGVGGLFALAEGNRQELTQELTWEVARANETLMQERRVLSMIVHGPLQSTIASISLAIQEGVGEQWESTHQQARVKLQEIIDRLENDPLGQRSLTSEVELLVSTWAGVCEVEADVSVEVSDALETDWVAAGTAADVLIEAVSNSAVHGGASRVWITLTLLNERTLLIKVMNNGSPAAVEAPSGLGSQFLEDVSIAWEREPVDGGVVLRVWLPILGDGGEPGGPVALESRTVLDGYE